MATARDDAMLQLHSDLSYLCEQAAGHFAAGAKVTLVVRHPHLPGDTSVLVTSDGDMDAVVAEIRKRQATRPDVVIR